MLMGGSIVTSCSLRVLLSTCVYPGLCDRERGQQKQTKFSGTYVYKRGLIQKNRGYRLYPLPSGKKSLWARHASYSARIELKTRPQVPDGLPVSTYLKFWLNVLVRRDEFENRRNFHKILRVYV